MRFVAAPALGMATLSATLAGGTVPPAADPPGVGLIKDGSAVLVDYGLVDK